MDIKKIGDRHKYRTISTYECTCKRCNSEWTFTNDEFHLDQYCREYTRCPVCGAVIYSMFVTKISEREEPVHTDWLDKVISFIAKLF